MITNSSTLRAVRRPALFFVSLVGAGAIARADDAAPLRLNYSAPSECPRVDRFIDQVRVRAPNVRFTEDGARAFVVRVSARRPRFEGRLTVREVDGSEAERTVTGDSCAETISALALIAAVAAESPPESTKAALTSPAAESASATPAPRAPEPAADAGAPEKPRDAREPEQAEAAPREAARAQPTWTLALGAQGGVVSGASPDALVTVPVFAEAASRSEALLSPAVRLRFEHAGSGSIDAAGASAHFVWTAGSVDVCPAHVAAGNLRLFPCARVEAGVLDAEGLDVQPARDRVRPWARAGLAGRGRVTAVGPLFLELEAAVLAALVRDRFFFQPGATVFRPPPVGVSASAGIGVTIW
jgi:hypothetical protein